MVLNQKISKIVPYMDIKMNNKLVSDSRDLEIKYLFMNLAIRSKKNIEKFRCFKIIWDIEDSIMFIFCTEDQLDWFTVYMEETYNF